MVDLSIVMLVYQRVKLHFPMGFPIFLMGFPMFFFSGEQSHRLLRNSPFASRRLGPCCFAEGADGIAGPKAIDAHGNWWDGDKIIHQ